MNSGLEKMTGLRDRGSALLEMEKYLILHCAPTLASLTTANLFGMKLENGAEIERQLARWNHQLREKGIFLMLLKQQEGRALVYVCRESHLRRDLCRHGVARFLAGYGYDSMDPLRALERLKERLNESAVFPHEIGIFLGYPLGDVVGFIRNSGKNCKCVGCWKVYCNECDAIKTFARYQKCQEIYARLWKQGKTVQQLTVAV